MNNFELEHKFYVLMIFGYPFFAVASALIPVIDGVATPVFRAVTMFLAIFVLIVSGRRRVLIGGFSVLLLFFALYGLRLLVDHIVTPSSYSLERVIPFLMVVVGSLAAYLSARHSYSDLRLSTMLLWPSFFLTLGLFCLWFLDLGYNPWEQYGHETTRFGLLRLNPISIAYYCWVAIFVSVTLLLKPLPSAGKYFLCLLTLVMAIVVMLAASSRGPIIAGVFTLFLLLSNGAKNRVKLLTFFSVVTLVLLYGSALVTSVLGRFQFFDADNMDLSSLDRVIGMQSAFESFLASPIYGRFAIDPSLGPEYYPHNLFLEVMMSMGLVGLALILVLVGSSLVICKRTLVKNAPLLMALYINSLILFQISGNIAGAGIYFLLLSLVLSQKNIHTKVTT